MIRMMTREELDRQLSGENNAWTNVTALSPESQKSIAVDMWMFIKDYYSRCYGLKYNEMKSAFELKEEFSKLMFSTKGIDINWKSKCLLCEIHLKWINTHSVHCGNCPLPNGGNGVCFDYNAIDLSSSSIRMMICDKIIKAIQSTDPDDIPYRRWR